MVDDAAETSAGDEDFERVPCSDELCTGVLDEAGVCGTCGRGALPGAVARGEIVGPFSPQRDEPATDAAEPDATLERVPCVDPMCTGILDEQGACGTCGRRG